VANCFETCFLVIALLCALNFCLWLFFMWLQNFAGRVEIFNA
jgi:hypothetical protein